MTNDEFNLLARTAKPCVLDTAEAFGIIVNKDLWPRRATTSPIDFASRRWRKTSTRRMVPDAFTSSGMDGSSSWRFRPSGQHALYYEFLDDGVPKARHHHRHT